MPIKSRVVRYEFFKETLKIDKNIRIGIFIYHQSCRGMSQKKINKSMARPVFVKLTIDLLCDKVKTAAGRVNGKF